MDDGNEPVLHSTWFKFPAGEIGGQVDARAEQHALVVLAHVCGSAGADAVDEPAQLDAEDVWCAGDGVAAGPVGVVAAVGVAAGHALHGFCREAGADEVGELAGGVVGGIHPVRGIGGPYCDGQLRAPRAVKCMLRLDGEHRLERPILSAPMLGPEKRRITRR